MIEGEIRCICSRVQINDLGLVLKKGDVVYLPAPKVMASQDLLRLRRGVEVRFVKRCLEERPPGPLVEVAKPLSAPVRGQPSPIIPAPSVEIKIDLDALAERVAARMPKVDETMLRQLVQMMMPLMGIGDSRRATSSVASGVLNKPQFIPEMGDLPSTDVLVQGQMEGGGTVDSAVEALKAARKPKV